MSSTPRVEVVSGRPPRPQAHKPSRAAWSTNYSPYAAGVRASPRASRHVQMESSSRPKRPLSASQVASTSSMAQRSPRPNSARLARPTSASQARYMELETIAFPMQTSGQLSASVCEGCSSPPPDKPAAIEAAALQETDSTALKMKLDALLKVWEDEQPNFRSSALFCETTFTQAKALMNRMPRPNTFLSAVSFACLTQMNVALDDQFPFLNQVIDELRAAVYSNYEEVQRQLKSQQYRRNPSALFFELGKPWFQEFAEQKMRTQSSQSAVDSSKSEIKLLTEMLQEARASTAAAVTAAKEAASHRREQLDAYYIPPTLHLKDLSFESLCEEIVNAFATCSNADARHLLNLLLENAVEREMPKLSDTLAAAVGNMKSQDRREFLRECFDYVTPTELQDALHARDEANDDKRYQTLLDDLHELLQLQPSEENRDSKQTVSPKLALFHSEESRISKRVHELMELVEGLAVEVSLFDSKTSSLLSESLRGRLRTYECPVKRLKREHEMLQQKPQDGDNNPQCECVCGRHRLIDEMDNEDQSPIIPGLPLQQLESQEEDAKAQKPRRRSSSNRPLSAVSGRRKNAIFFGSRFTTPRKSSATIHVFPLAEVCHLVSAILHLQFSRDAAELTPAAGSEAVSVLTFDERWVFLRRDAASRSFKTLAKDYLVRKYGIKSIAVMHTLQLERSLLHYSEKDNHVRCELYGWFFGADKARLESKDFAFAFFQKLVKCILGLFVAKKTPRSNSIASSAAIIQTLAYSTLISMWTEYIGDGEPTTSRTIPASLVLEACKLAFPPTMQRNSHFTLFREKLYRRSLEQKTLELEEFFRNAMTAWQLTFDEQMQEAAKTVDAAGVLDIDGFTRCLTTNGLDFTTGERYELFDMLTQDDVSDIPSKSLVHFIMDARYLKS